MLKFKRKFWRQRVKLVGQIYQIEINASNNFGDKARGRIDATSSLCFHLTQFYQVMYKISKNLQQHCLLHYGEDPVKCSRKWWESDPTLLFWKKDPSLRHLQHQENYEDSEEWRVQIASRNRSTSKRWLRFLHTFQTRLLSVFVGCTLSRQYLYTEKHVYCMHFLPPESSTECSHLIIHCAKYVPFEIRITSTQVT